jgi:alpha,alpha-trehalose phosphorylase
MLNVPNAKGVDIEIDGDASIRLTGTLGRYERVLDLRSGVLVRSLEWTAPGGKRIALRSRRVVSFANKHLFAIEIELTPAEFLGPVVFRSFVDGAVKNQEAGDDPRVGSAVSGPALQTVSVEQAGAFSALVQRTHNSGFGVISAIQTVVEGVEASAWQEGQRAGQSFECAAVEGQPCA